MEVGVVTFLLMYGLVLPYLTYKSYLSLKSGDPLPELSTRQLYIRTILTLLVLAVPPALLAYQIDGLTLFFPWRPTALEILIGVAMLIGWYLLRERLLTWVQKTTPPNIPLRFPETPRQLFLWACVSMTAGICEEITYRGVLFACLDWRLHQPLLSAILCAAAFAIAHMIQGPRSAWFVFFMALTFHGLVYISGNLYVAMIIHTAFDFAVGLKHYLHHKRRDPASATLS